MAKAHSYIRFSSTKQEKGDSLNRQQELINKWLIKNPEVELSNLAFKDLGISGYHGNHLKHDFGRLLDAIEDNKIKNGDYILVEAIDRIGRLPMLKALNVLTGICLHGVEIITLEDNQSYSEIEIERNAGIIYHLIGKIDMAHNYSKSLSKRIQASWDAKREKADKGITPKRKSFWWLTRCPKSDMFEILTDSDKAILNEVFKQFNCGVSYARIVDYLKNLNDDRFSNTSHPAIRQWITSKTCLGYWEDNKIYPQAIDDATFAIAQNEHKERNKGKVQGAASGHVLAGLVKCSNCGSNYSVRNHKHSASVMFCGKGKRGKAHCSNTKSIPLAIFDEFRYKTQIEYLYKIMSSEVQQKVESELLGIDAKIKECNLSIENIENAIESKEIKNKTRLYKKLDKLQDELERYQLDKMNIASTNKTKFDLVKSTSKTFSTGIDDLLSDHNKLNGMLKSIGYAIQANNNKIWINNASLSYEGFNQAKGNYRCLNQDNEEVFINKVQTQTIESHKRPTTPLFHLAPK
jgi:DNA invertase Pin-like site-specific DNA recombinase